MTDPQTTRDEARDAKELLENKPFLMAIISLRKQWFAELMASPAGGALEQRLVAKLQALEEIPLKLNSYVNSGKMLEKR